MGADELSPRSTLLRLSWLYEKVNPAQIKLKPSLTEDVEAQLVSQPSLVELLNRPGQVPMYLFKPLKIHAQLIYKLGLRSCLK